MPASIVELKLKQASAVLGVSAKDLQNLVQLKVIRPRRKDNLYWFDGRLLLEAKVALYLKESLGSSSELLSLFTGALSRSIASEGPKTRRFISLQSLPPQGQQPIEIRIPLGSLARELEERMPQAQAHKDLPRGRRRAGWRDEMRRALGDAAKQIGNVKTGEIVATVKAHRRRPHVLPEVTVVANRALKTA
jgi:hypothetical protein